MKMQNKPNIIIVITDQENVNTLSCYGGQLNTPSIDKLAAKGVRFTKNYVACPLCVPSRDSIWTSLYPHQLGLPNIVDNGDGVVHVNDDGREISLPTNVQTLGDLANENGYRTAYFGKWHLGRENAKQHGFQVFKTDLRGSYEQRLSETNKMSFKKGTNRLEQQGLEPFELQEDTVMTDMAINFIEDSSKDFEKPFFLVLSMRFPHDPYSGPFDDLLSPDHIKLPESVKDDLKNKPSSQRRGASRELFLREIGSDITDKEMKKLRSIYARYLGLMHLVDLNVGRLTDKLNSLSIAKNTIIIFTSDHGDMMGAHGLFFKGLFMYEEVTKVPLIISWPGHLPEGKEVASLTSMIDFTPTLLDLMEIEKPISMAGESMRQLWDYSHNIRNAVFMELFESYGEWGTIFSIRTEKYKYNWYAGDSDELYDVENDPNEMNNIAMKPEYRDLIIGLREQLARWLKQTGDVKISDLIRTYPGRKPGWVSLGGK